MLKIWGRRDALNVQKVLWCCAEVGAEFERTDAGRQYGVVNTAEYLAKNPNARVPTLEDGDLVLWESNTIVRYLSAKYSFGKLYPEDLGQRAESEKWMDWKLTTVFMPYFRPLYLTMLRVPADRQDRAQIDEWQQKVIEKLGILDRHLASRPFVAGERLTVGDIPIGTLVGRWYGIDLERPSMRHLEAWYARLCERPGFREHVLNEIESQLGKGGVTAI